MARGTREEPPLLVVLPMLELPGLFSIAEAKWSGIQSSSVSESSPIPPGDPSVPLKDRVDGD